MGKKTVWISDLSGQVLDAGDNVVSVVVLEHPDLLVGPVRLDLLPAEVEQLDDASLDVAVLEIHDGDGDPRRVVVNASEFDAMATAGPMPQVLRTAERVKPAKVTGRKAKRPPAEPTPPAQPAERAGTATAVEPAEPVGPAEPVPAADNGLVRAG